MRNYSAAVEPLARAEIDPSIRSKAFALRVYALCMSGRTGEAQRAVHQRVAQTLDEKGFAPDALVDANAAPFWPWMKQTFGIERQ
jgi:hypothetical protein